LQLISIIFLILGIVGVHFYNKKINQLLGTSTTKIENKQYTFTVNNTPYSGTATSNAKGHEVVVYYVKTNPTYNTTDNLAKLTREMWKHNFISGSWKAMYVISIILIVITSIILIFLLFSDRDDDSTKRGGNTSISLQFANANESIRMKKV